MAKVEKELSIKPKHVKFIPAKAELVIVMKTNMMEKLSVLPLKLALKDIALANAQNKYASLGSQKRSFNDAEFNQDDDSSYDDENSEVIFTVFDSS